MVGLITVVQEATEELHHFGQIRAPAAAPVFQVSPLLPRAVGRDPIEQLRVDAVAHHQAVESILSGPAAFFILDPEHCELTFEVAEGDGVFAGITTRPHARSGPLPLLRRPCFI